MDIETFEQGGKVYWSGIFRSTQIATLLLANQDWDTFLKNWKTVTGSRKRLINFTVYQNGGKANFAGLFRDLGEKHSLWVGQSRKDFEAKVKELASTQGLRLLDMNAYRSGGTVAPLRRDVPLSGHPQGVLDRPRPERLQRQVAGGPRQADAAGRRRDLQGRRQARTSTPSSTPVRRGRWP